MSELPSTARVVIIGGGAVGASSLYIQLPFLLEGVAGERSLNQGDGIHPSFEGAQKVAGLAKAVEKQKLSAADRDSVEAHIATKYALTIA